MAAMRAWRRVAAMWWLEGSGRGTAFRWCQGPVSQDRARLYTFIGLAENGVVHPWSAGPPSMPARPVLGIQALPQHVQRLFDVAHRQAGVAEDQAGAIRRIQVVG